MNPWVEGRSISQGGGGEGAREQLHFLHNVSVTSGLMAGTQPQKWEMHLLYEPGASAEGEKLARYACLTEGLDGLKAALPPCGEWKLLSRGQESRWFPSWWKWQFSDLCFPFSCRFISEKLQKRIHFLSFSFHLDLTEKNKIKGTQSTFHGQN